MSESRVEDMSTALTKFPRSFRRLKIFSAAAFSLWLFGVLELVVMRMVPLGLLASMVGSLVLEAVAGIGAYLYLRASFRPWMSSRSCSNAGSVACSQPGCEVSSGGCLAKINREVESEVAKMERQKLRLLLRWKVGPDLVLWVFWAVVGIKIVSSWPSQSVVGGVVLVVGSVALAAARIALGFVAFG